MKVLVMGIEVRLRGAGGVKHRSLPERRQVKRKCSVTLGKN
jgi:hypothetical protein